MDKSGKFLLPSPKFLKLDKIPTSTPHFLSPQGMMLPKEQQPPPMYGPRGSTFPPKFLGHQQNSSNPHQQPDRTPKFHCDPCEAEFHTSTDFKVHRSEHVQCEIDNCSFQGHPSFMDTHIGLQHVTGLYSELKKLSTPEEIAEWRDQRKKNYPTVAAVLQKQKAREQRMLRGEKLEAKKNRFGKREDRRQIRTEQQGEPGEAGGKKFSRRQNRKRNRFGKPVTEKEDKKVEVLKKNEEETVDSSVCRGLKMFTGTGGMVDYKKVKKVEAHALTGLLGMYGSDSEDENNSCEDTENIDFDQSVTHVELKDVNEETTRGETQATQPNATDTPEKRTNEESSQPNTHTTELQDTSGPPAPQDTEDDETPEEAPIVKLSDGTPELSAQQSSDDEGPEEVPIEKSLNTNDRPQLLERTNGTADVEGPNETQIATSADSSEALKSTQEDAPKEIPIAKSSNVPDKRQSTKNDKKVTQKKRRPYGLDYKKLRVGRQNTLLEKLLETDIRHERNVLLQCVRFVVQNNFFGIGSPTKQPDA